MTLTIGAPDLIERLTTERDAAAEEEATVREQIEQAESALRSLKHAHTMARYRLKKATEELDGYTLKR